MNIFQQSDLRKSENGNVIFFVLLAVVLIGLVTAAIRSGGEGANIDKETLLIRVSETRQYANELERGLRFIMERGASEADLRFAHPDANSDYGDINTNPEFQLFNRQGGGARYRIPPSDISGAGAWEFYGHTHLPEVGTSEADLIAVMPLVTQTFCARINEINGFDEATEPLDNTGDCINAGAAHRFRTGNLFSTGAGIDTVNDATFTSRPAMQGCVRCGADYHFYHVLKAR